MIGLSRTGWFGAIVLAGLVLAPGAQAHSDARCILQAQISFSQPISTSQSIGDISSDWASWSCDGVLADHQVMGSQQLSLAGQFGRPSDAVVGDFGPDTRMNGDDSLTLSDRPGPEKPPMTLPDGLALRLRLDRSAASFNVAGGGTLQGQGVIVSGSGTFDPGSAISCLVNGWSSGKLTMVLDVTDGPEPSAGYPRRANGARAHHARGKRRHAKHKHMHH